MAGRCLDCGSRRRSRGFEGRGRRGGGGAKEDVLLPLARPEGICERHVGKTVTEIFDKKVQFLS